MAEPLDVVMAFHNAFRRDMSGIDAAALESALANRGTRLSSNAFGFSMKCWFGTLMERKSPSSPRLRLLRLWWPRRTREITRDLIWHSMP